MSVEDAVRAIQAMVGEFGALNRALDELIKTVRRDERAKVLAEGGKQ